MADNRGSRVKRFAKRSRSGCATCKKRHIRCDAQRPICLNCAYKGLECYYQPHMQHPCKQADQELALPGMQQPWIAVVQVPSACVDPFDSLPIKMPLKSQELFSYFARAREDICSVASPDHKLVLAMQDEHSFRNILVISGLHHMWRIGSLREYELTFLYHKIQCIQAIRRLLGTSIASYDFACMNMIATLCIAEASSGSIQVAENHLSALMAMMETVWTKQIGVDLKQNSRYEMLERFVLICVHEIVLRRRAADNQKLSQLSEGLADDLKDRLDALCYLPNYIITTTGAPLPVDASVSIAGLQTITSMKYEESHSNRGNEPNYGTVGRMWAVAGGEESMLSSIAQQISPDPVTREYSCPRPELPISWVGMTLSTGFYLHGVLQIWSFLEGDMLSWFTVAQQRHIDETKADIASGLQSQRFWFWKLFSAAFTIESVYLHAQTEGRADGAVKGGERKLESLRHWFDDRIRLWQSVSGVTSWNYAREALEAVAWPLDFPEDGLARSIWERASQG